MTSPDLRNTLYYTNLVRNRKIAIIPEFVLESGIILREGEVAYSTWGTLNKSSDNVVIVCHALTGSSDASDWWRPLLGRGKALDSSRYFIFCANVLGSPYGSASPLSVNPATGMRFGPTFPDTTVRDDVRIHKLVLDTLGVRSIAVVIGGSMGGMHTLEWPLCTPAGYIRDIIPIATSPHQSAWGIAWGETQCQTICSDANFDSGWYDPTPEGQPRFGLGAARMIGMLTYRSHNSFEARFGRRAAPKATKSKMLDGLPTPPQSDAGSTSSITGDMEETSPTRYSAQSYLQYQADKFLERFDANCYLHLLRKMNTHDVTRGRTFGAESSTLSEAERLREALSCVAKGALVVGVGTDLLFPVQQQVLIAQCLPKATFTELQSDDGHDGFLLEFETLGKLIQDHLFEKHPQMYEGPGDVSEIVVEESEDSVFGETENFDS